MTPLERFATDLTGPVLVLHDPASADAATALAEHGHSVHPWDEPLPDAESWGGLALVVADRSELRRAAAALPALGRTRAVACLLTLEDRPTPFVPRPGWPRVASVYASRLPAGGALTVVRLDEELAALDVLHALARCSSPAGFVADRDGTVAAGAALADGPLDEGVLNPMGFDPEPTLGMVDLSTDGPTGLRLRGVEGLDALDPSRGAVAHVVAALRSHRGVRVSAETWPPALDRTVTGLAMAGVPLVAEPLPADSRGRLGDRLHDVLTEEPDLADPLRREEHSIGLRRAALLDHSAAAWRDRAAVAAGRPSRRFPTCSVVLSTRRPDLVDFAVRQVARQRGTDVELIVVGHGFEPDAALIRQRLAGRPVEVLHRPEETLFGDVLDAGVRAASGDLVVKMDDDDWYGRDFLLDLLLAREYSGAGVVGAPAEFVYLSQLDRTVRTRDTGERFARLVAGGTMALPRDLVHELGGFRPVRRFVDRQLLVAAATAGVGIYRTHGLGYRLRRTSGGHTWDPGIDFFLDEKRASQQWDGFLASPILDPDPEDVPRAASTRVPR